MNWAWFQVGALAVLRWASYIIGAGLYGYLWWRDRKVALIVTGILAGWMLLIGSIAGNGIYIGQR